MQTIGAFNFSTMHQAKFMVISDALFFKNNIKRICVVASENKNRRERE